MQVTSYLSYQPTDTSRLCIFSGYSPKAATLVLSASKAWERMQKVTGFRRVAYSLHTNISEPSHIKLDSLQNGLILGAT